MSIGTKEHIFWCSFTLKDPLCCMREGHKRKTPLIFQTFPIHS